MSFVVKKHSKEEFYDEFSSLLDKHHFPRINKMVLPENCFAVYNEDDIVLYSFWVYFTDSQLMWLAFPVSNKSIPIKRRRGAFEVLLEHISNYAKRKGIISLFTTSNTEGVIEPLLKSGFEIGDSNVHHYLKKVQ
jgi:hypothetical protein